MIKRTARRILGITPSLDNIHLDKLNHPFGGGMCAMEAVAYYTNTRHTDKPKNSSVLLTYAVQYLNDSWSDTERQKLIALVPDLAGTREDTMVDVHRFFRAFDVVGRKWLLEVAPQVQPPQAITRQNWRGKEIVDKAATQKAEKIYQRNQHYETLVKTIPVITSVPEANHALEIISSTEFFQAASKIPLAEQRRQNAIVFIESMLAKVHARSKERSMELGAALNNTTRGQSAGIGSDQIIELIRELCQLGQAELDAIKKQEIADAEFKEQKARLELALIAEKERAAALELELAETASLIKEDEEAVAINLVKEDKPAEASALETLKAELLAERTRLQEAQDALAKEKATRIELEGHHAAEAERLTERLAAQTEHSDSLV